MCKITETRRNAHIKRLNKSWRAVVDYVDRKGTVTPKQILSYAKRSGVKSAERSIVVQISRFCTTGVFIRVGRGKIKSPFPVERIMSDEFEFTQENRMRIAARIAEKNLDQLQSGGLRKIDKQIEAFESIRLVLIMPNEFLKNNIDKYQQIIDEIDIASLPQKEDDQFMTVLGSK